MRTSFGRLLVVALLPALPLVGCGGELYLDANDSRIDFDDIDRDPSDSPGGGDNGDGGGNTDDGDFDGDSILGDGFGDFDGDGSGGGCGFSTEPCATGQECIDGTCVAICAVARCEISRECCATGTECVYDRYCNPPCPSAADDRCGTTGQLCCDSSQGFVCNEGVSCIKDCSLEGGGQLCGTGSAATFGTVCCDVRVPGNPNDDDVCVFNQCVQRGAPCQSFLDCEAGEYCELALDPDPTTGYCLPNEFPPDAPVCQAPPDDTFAPRTEWSWVGVQLVGSSITDTDFTNDFTDGQRIRKCNDANDTLCYREPCTDNPTTAAPSQSATNFRTQCFRSVETIPVTADLDKVDSDPGAGERFVPEVMFKAYADNTFDNVRGNVLIIADGRDESELPDTGIPSKQQRTKVVIWGVSRGHVAVANIDNDPQLEIVAAQRNGLQAFDPYDASGNPVANNANTRKWATAAGSLNTRYSGAAPHFADFDADGVPEIVIAGVIVRSNGASASVLVDLGTANQANESNGGARCGADDQECFALSAVADVNLDGVPELLAGDRAWSIRRNPTGGTNTGTCGAGGAGTWRNGICSLERIAGTDGWVADRIWSASYRAGSTPQPITIGEARGFAGVANFIDNRLAKYGRAKDFPEVAYVNAGVVYIVSGETGEVMASPIAGNDANLAFRVTNNRGGPPNIADFDGDGRPEVSFAGTGCMVVVDPDCAAATPAARAALANTAGSGCNVAVPTSPGPTRCSVEVPTSLADEIGVLWQYQTQDQSSAVTGTSVFDFQGDGKAEVLYNDECFFRVFEGATSNILYERPNSHRTATEYPTVVDVDGDSNSEIVVVSTGDQSSAQSNPRDRCGGPAPATPTTCNSLNETDCNNTSGCRFLLGSCRPYAYRRNAEQYSANACTCTDHGATDCAAARGCRWTGSSCVVVTAATTANNCGSYGTRATCQAHVDDCLWDEYSNCGSKTTSATCTAVQGCTWNSGPSTCTGTAVKCEENPRGQAYICQQSTWGVTVYGDTSDQWVKTLPYWYEHPYHITNQDRAGRVVPDWGVCYSGAQCIAETDVDTCENTFVSGNSGPLCDYGDANPDFYNNFRQNVPGFVPLNAPDLQVEAAIAALNNCPPQVTIVARIVNKGRAGVRAADANIRFYRLSDEAQTPLQTAATTAFAELPLPQDLLPGGSAQVSATYNIQSNEVPFNLDFRVIANPEFLTSPGSGTFECNDTNNSEDVLNLDCTGVGG